MKLGDGVQITISTHDLGESLPFYQGLGFQVVDRNDGEDPWVQVSDGEIVLLLGQDQAPYQGLTYFAVDMAERVEKLAQGGLEFSKRAENPSQPFQAALFDPSDCGISLIQYDPQRMYKPGGKPVTRCGRFGELSIPTGNLKNSLDFWMQFGFENPDGIIQEPYPWAVLSDGLIKIGLHQTKHFTDVMITYFAPDMARRIELLRQAGFRFEWEEKDQQGNLAYALIHSPEGQGIFLFKEPE